jgi:hypothetical protein
MLRVSKAASATTAYLEIYNHQSCVSMLVILTATDCLSLLSDTVSASASFKKQHVLVCAHQDALKVLDQSPYCI